MLNATIIYLKDNDEGDVEVNMEIVGDPTRSFVIGNTIVNNIENLKEVVFRENEFSRMPPTNRLQ
jgi:hypothetical protein